MADTKTEMKRDGTMQATAKEGIRFLRESGGETGSFLANAVQEVHSATKDGDAGDASGGEGDDSVPPCSVQKPKIHRDSTMAITVKEGEQFVKEQDKKVNNETSSTPPAEEPTENTNDAKKVPEPKKGGKGKMTKATTMMQTKKEGEAFLAAAEEKEAEKKDKSNDEPSVKKSKVEKVDKSKDKSGNKRLNTIERTAEEGKELLIRMGMNSNNPEGERRVTRAQSRGEPAPVSQVTKTNAKKNDTKESSKKRGRAKKVVTPPESEDEEEVDEKEEEEEMEVEKNDTAKENKSNEQQDKKSINKKKQPAVQKKKNNVAVSKKKANSAN